MPHNAVWPTKILGTAKCTSAYFRVGHIAGSGPRDMGLDYVYDAVVKKGKYLNNRLKVRSIYRSGF